VRTCEMLGLAGAHHPEAARVVMPVKHNHNSLHHRLRAISITLQPPFSSLLRCVNDARRPCSKHSQNRSDPSKPSRERHAEKLSPSTLFFPPQHPRQQVIRHSIYCIAIELTVTSSSHDGRPHLCSRRRRVPRRTRSSSALLCPSPVERGDRPPVAGGRWVCQSNVRYLPRLLLPQRQG